MNCTPENGVATIANLGCLFGNVVQSLIALAGIVLFIILIIGGFKYITSGGDPKAIEGAQKTITYAIIGLVVIILSFAILSLIKAITGVDVGNFNVVLQK